MATIKYSLKSHIELITRVAQPPFSGWFMFMFFSNDPSPWPVSFHLWSGAGASEHEIEENIADERAAGKGQGRSTPSCPERARVAKPGHRSSPSAEHP